MSARDTFHVRRRRFNKNKGRNGVALVVVLSAVLVISILITLFLANTSLNRQISLSSAGQSRSESIALLGMETVVGDLRTEIIAGSTNNAITPLVYHPVTNSAIVPSRVGDNGILNIVKKSIGGSNAWSGTYYNSVMRAPVRAALNNSTTNSSRNGRRIKPEHWNAPYLMGKSIPTSFRSPDWVLVQRSGAVTDASNLPSMAALSNSERLNDQYIIGRFAYIIYDEGGLIDVNVAGYPSNVSSDFSSRRGILAQVDIGNIPGVLNGAGLVEWRNHASKINYANYSFGNTNGFTRVYPGDQRFVSRKDLIEYAKDHPDQLDLLALEFLGTTTRDVNSPSHSPSPTRSRVGAADDAINPSLIDTRVSVPFIRQSDGTRAEVGDSLIKYRFPLTRFALFADITPSAAIQSERYFGLKRASDSSPWVYRDGATSISTLEAVAAAGREPDFFELLQAAILTGSVGVNVPRRASDTVLYDQSTYLQIAQIGANLLDQYDSDSYPTRISFGTYPYELCGVENLPYLARIFETIAQFPGTETTGVWYQPEVWNPHAKLNIPSTTPTKFRVKCSGQAAAVVNVGSSGAIPYFLGPTDLTTSNGITFETSSHDYSVPRILAPENGASANGVDNFVIGSKTLLGINIGTVTIPSSEMGSGQRPRSYSATPQSPLTYELQYWDTTSNNYVTYDRMRRVDSGVGVYIESLLSGVPRSFVFRSDPRTDRFGLFKGYDNIIPGNTIRPDSAPGVSSADGVYIGLFSDNVPTSKSRYADRDGETRPADGAYASPGNLAGYPLATDNLASRPIVLNRPFRSVAEMGYASKGSPWKHLDLFTDKTGDAAILDVFSVNDPAIQTGTERGLSAGSVSLNSKQIPVLAALLEGALKAEDDNSTISAAEANTLAAAIAGVSQGSSGPFSNKADLVTELMPELPDSTLDFVVKRRREAVVRALADIGTTRTWNLFVDVIGQSGRFNKNSTDLNDFQVDGEKRYWLHLTIDRLTGEVVSRQMETYNE